MSVGVTTAPPRQRLRLYPRSILVSYLISGKHTKHL